MPISCKNTGSYQLVIRRTSLVINVDFDHARGNCEMENYSWLPAVHRLIFTPRMYSRLAVIMFHFTQGQDRPSQVVGFVM
jgi:hypothetical protein